MDSPALPEADATAPHADAKANVEIRAVVTRADGTVEDLGVIAATYERSRRRQLSWRLFGRRRAARRIAAANRNVKGD